MSRVVSLVPSVTETLLAWGVSPAACTRFCEQPDLPHVGGTKDPDVAAIVGLAPDLVVMCVEENRREDAGGPGRRRRGDGVAVDRRGGRRGAGVADAGGAGRRRGRDARRRRAGAGPPVARAFVPIWKRPWMSLAGGTYGSSLLAAARGGQRVRRCRPGGDRYPTVTLDEARARRPDVVLAPSEPYPFAERHVPLLEEVAPVVLVDGQDLFWWGVRTPAALAPAPGAALLTAGCPRR